MFSQDQKYGVLAGGNFSNLLGDYEEIIPSERRLSIHLGVFGDFAISPKVSVVPQLIYSSQGLRDTGIATVFPTFEFENGNLVEGTTTITSEGSYILDYLTAPIQLKYAVGKDFNLVIGPQVAFLVDGRFRGTTTIDGVTEKDNSNVDVSEKFDYGGFVGVAYKPLSKMFVELKYYQGFADTNKNEDFIIGGDVTMRNSIFQMSLGYYIF
ncbi:porin family protein [Flagellimonas myxillae]|uniref:porin family protein n=1 Tax=Flagellimonas myxillae TaxID=2942214 RepID=UPI00201F4355|nr:porin family protein [Muricauda myxillae]MCL6266768.1 PorT family protein [Muricauda myxillae]